MAQDTLAGQLDTFLAEYESELIEFRRDMHAHPEIGNCEHRATSRIAQRLESAGLRPSLLPEGTGLIADVPGGSAENVQVALRADIDALPMPDEKRVPYRSLNSGACHACGHDVHTSVVLGTGLFLARLADAGALPGKVRLIFQPAEEVPGGARQVIAAGGIADVPRIFALHCDPKVDVGKIGTRIGPITAAFDKIKVELTGPGGHTARPHLTADLVFALGKIISEVPAGVSRRMDPRSGMSVVWGRVNAGTAPNVIPDRGVLEGTVRCLDDEAWHVAPDLLKDLIETVASTYGTQAVLTYERGNPPTVNDQVCTNLIAASAVRMLGNDAITQAPQSLGGEDFAWYLTSIPGSLFRLGTRRPGSLDDFDIHQPTFDVDERCISVGVKVMTAAALAGIGLEAASDENLALSAVIAPSAGPAEHLARSGPALTGPLLGRAGHRPAGPLVR
jgi:amidohydrolase